MSATFFTCPHCHRKSDYEEMLMDADLHAIIKLLPTFGPHANLVAAYTELFGISPLKTKRKKWRLLLEEMKRLFDAESFDYNRRRYNISRSAIAEALNVAAKKNFAQPLENHNYLKKIMISISEREGKSAGIEAEKDLRRKEAGLMSGSRPTARPEPVAGRYPEPPEHVLPPMKSMPAAELTDAALAANKERVRNILKGIGG